MPLGALGPRWAPTPRDAQMHAQREVDMVDVFWEISTEEIVEALGWPLKTVGKWKRNLWFRIPKEH